MSLLDHFMLTIPLIIHPSTNYKAARSTIYYHNSHIQPAFAAIFTYTTCREVKGCVQAYAFTTTRQRHPSVQEFKGCIQDYAFTMIDTPEISFGMQVFTYSNNAPVCCVIIINRA